MDDHRHFSRCIPYEISKLHRVQRGIVEQIEDQNHRLTRKVKMLNCQL